MTEIEQLIERLKAATGPDRELDKAIWIALGAKPPTLEQPGYWTRPPDGSGEIMLAYGDSFVPVFTGSVDAALTLLPDGWHGRTSTSGEAEAIGPDEVHKSYWTRFYKGSVTLENYGKDAAAIALCVAALSARAVL